MTPADPDHVIHIENLTHAYKTHVALSAVTFQTKSTRIKN